MRTGGGRAHDPVVLRPEFSIIVGEVSLLAGLNILDQSAESVTLNTS